MLVLAAIVVGFSMNNRNEQPSSIETNRLSDAEVEDYQGERLDSIDDFRENSIKGPQYVDVEKYRLTVDGLVKEEKSYTYDQVLSFPLYKKVVTIHCVEGWSVKILWEGILVKDLLEASGIKPDARIVIFSAHDGYTTSLSIDYIYENDIILASRMNGVRLPPERGFPFQLVAQNKWGYKWIKWVGGIRLSDDEDYKGYWESRGYNNNADINGPKIGQ